MREREEEYSEIKNKNETFRKNIRRHSIQSFFQERRRQILQHQDDQQLRKQLGNNIKQSQFITNCGRQLTGQPCNNWMSTIKKLKSVSILFQGQFDIWISRGIIRSLVQTFEQQFKELHLAPEAASLLGDLVYLSYEKHTNFTEKLMEYQFLIKLITLAQQYTYNIEQRVKIFSCLGNIADYSYKYRDQIVRDGGGAVMIELCKNLLSSKEQQRHLWTFLCSSMGFISLSYKGKNSVRPNLNIVHTFLPQLGKILRNQQFDTRTHKSCLNIFIQILKTGKQALLKTIFTQQGIQHRLLALILHPDIQVRKKALSCLCYLSYSQYQQISVELLKAGVLNIVYQSYQRLQSKNHVGFARLSLLIMANIASNSQALTEVVFHHPLFLIVFSQIESQRIENVKQAFFCLNAIVSKLKYNDLQKLIYEMEVLKYLIKGLLQMREVEFKILLDILQSISILIEKTQQIYNPHGNPLVDQLQKIYNFSPILQNISSKCKHRLLNEWIHRLQDQLVTALSQNFVPL